MTIHSQKITKGLVRHYFSHHSKNGGFIQHYFLISKNSAGFTLIEVIVYIALLTFIMGGFLFSVYQIVNSHGRTENKIYSQEEGTFLLHKIDWALTGASTITTPPANDEGDMLVLENGGETLTFALDVEGHVELKRGAGAFIDLSSDDVTVTELHFDHTAVGFKPPRMIATLKVDGKEFETVKYLR